mmetsp:Transcript_16791/g.15142  ORF Transcript_16791/g.15142 Transcript_16791/m.15142 type:complete len:115 (+) Transcript_16791:64-408(+)
MICEYCKSVSPKEDKCSANQLTGVHRLIPKSASTVYYIVNSSDQTCCMIYPSNPLFTIQDLKNSIIHELRRNYNDDIEVNELQIINNNKNLSDDLLINEIITSHTNPLNIFYKH